MKIKDIISSNKVTVSFEIFPPKEWAKIEDTKEVVNALSVLSPAFMSVTYGAGGTTSSNTVEIASEVEKHGIPALAHITCVSSEKDKLRLVLDKLKENKIENILALRGDIPTGVDFVNTSEYHHANELIKAIKKDYDFCVGGACYPEGHPESQSFDKDIDCLKYKIDAGADFLTSQMFFDNNIFYSFRYRMLRKNIDIPVIAGIMPVTNAKQITRITSLSGTMLPPKFKAIVDRFADNEAAMQQAGIAYATEQIIDLIANGVNNIHVYTMNKPFVANTIMNSISEIIR